MGSRCVDRQSWAEFSFCPGGQGVRAQGRVLHRPPTLGLAPGRMRWIQRRVDHVLAILPFEEPLYRQAGVRCTFVGNPILDEVAPAYDRPALRRQFGLSLDGPVIGLFPGSRKGELREHMPLLLETVRRLAERHPTMQFILAQASTVPDRLLEEFMKDHPVPIRVCRNQASEVMAASDLLVVKSGTSTLQAAVVGTPLMSPMTWFPT